jgi:hypothetical protein
MLLGKLSSSHLRPSRRSDILNAKYCKCGQVFGHGTFSSAINATRACSFASVPSYEWSCRLPAKYVAENIRLTKQFVKADTNSSYISSSLLKLFLHLMQTKPPKLDAFRLEL